MGNQTFLLLYILVNYFGVMIYFMLVILLLSFFFSASFFISPLHCGEAGMEAGEEEPGSDEGGG